MYHEKMYILFCCSKNLVSTVIIHQFQAAVHVSKKVSVTTVNSKKYIFLRPIH